MFAKKNRLAKLKDIQVVFAAGRSFFSPFFTIRFLRTKQASARFAVVISTKVSKRAVHRNRIRRLLREVLKLNLAILPPGDYIVIVKPAINRLPEQQYLKSFQALIREKITHVKKR